MVEENFLTFTPIRPNPQSIDAKHAVVLYNETSDTLYFHFDGRNRRAIVLENDSPYAMRVDPECHMVIGIQISAFMKRVVLERPELLAAAEALGVDSSLIEQARKQIDPERVRQAALDSILGSFIHEQQPQTA